VFLPHPKFASIRANGARRARTQAREFLLILSLLATPCFASVASAPTTKIALDFALYLGLFSHRLDVMSFLIGDESLPSEETTRNKMRRGKRCFWHHFGLGITSIMTRIDHGRRRFRRPRMMH
jgi:hypothetical protein